jgi:Spy/CpxP family protein refolding chaperone
MLGPRLPPPEVMERLNLTSSQRAKVDELLDSDRRKAIRADSEIRIAELDLQKQIDSDKPDPGAIDETIDRLMRLRREMLQARVATLVGIRAALTAEQRAKLRRPSPDSRWH